MNGDWLPVPGVKTSGTVRFFAIGVGNEINRPLLEQLAHQAGGFAAFVSAGDDFDRQAQAFRRKLLRPAAANPRIRFEGGGTYVLFAQLTGNPALTNADFLII